MCDVRRSLSSYNVFHLNQLAINEYTKKVRLHAMPEILSIIPWLVCTVDRGHMIALDRPVDVDLHSLVRVLSHFMDVEQWSTVEDKSPAAMLSGIQKERIQYKKKIALNEK